MVHFGNMSKNKEVCVKPIRVMSDFHFSVIHSLVSVLMLFRRTFKYAISEIINQLINRTHM